MTRPRRPTAPPSLVAEAAAHDGLVARWRLLDSGLSPEAARWAMRGLRRPFPGVAVTGWGPLTQAQRWRAATLTAPETALHVSSAAGVWGMRPDPGHVVTVVRPGNRGPNHSRGLRVAYSRSLTGYVVEVAGIPTTTCERTIIDLWPHLQPWDRSKMLREALRLRITTPASLLAAIERHRHRRAVGVLAAEVRARLALPFDRCRSDAEAFGLVVIGDAGVEIPDVNVSVAGAEADFSWPNLRLIVEIDGPQWHRFKEEDARNTARWTAAGFLVHRIPSDLVFRAPEELLRLAPPPASRRLRSPAADVQDP